MKNFIFIILLTVLLSQCSKDPNEVCSVKDPLSDLAWLKGLKTSIDINCHECEESIFQATYNNQTVFYKIITDPVCDYTFMVDLFNCEGELTKKFDHTSIDAFNKDVTNRKKIYSCAPSAK